EGWKWAPKKAGLELHRIPGAHPPAATDADRMEQMEKAARRFTAAELRGEMRQQADLRLLPKPLPRHSDPDAGLVGGAVFAFGQGPNPEALLVVEARKDGGWSYGLARLSSAEVFVRLDDREVWRVPALRGEYSPEERYFIVQPGQPPGRGRTQVPPPRPL